MYNTGNIIQKQWYRMRKQPSCGTTKSRQIDTSHVTSCKRIGLGTQSDQSESMLIKPRYEDIGYCSVKSKSLLKPGATRCHGTRIARGVPLPVYNNLDLYSGFWCTSRCVVFKYSVPPLTDQALRKVLLTS